MQDTYTLNARVMQGLNVNINIFVHFHLYEYYYYIYKHGEYKFYEIVVAICRKHLGFQLTLNQFFRGRNKLKIFFCSTTLLLFCRLFYPFYGQ